MGKKQFNDATKMEPIMQFNETIRIYQEDKKNVERVLTSVLSC
jgi:hypothetical protein